MTGFVWTVMAGFLLFLLLVSLRWKRSDQSAVRPNPQSIGPGPYRAVSIGYTAPHCLLVQALPGKRFLIADAPTLPLDGCTAAHCTCTYIHHADRRSSRRDRRRNESVSSAGQFKRERRLSAGRRSSDVAAI